MEIARIMHTGIEFSKYTRGLILWIFQFFASFIRQTVYLVLISRLTNGEEYINIIGH